MNRTPLNTVSILVSFAVCGSAFSGLAFSAQPDAALISQADSSVIVEAVANGLNPNTTIISSRFHCYAKKQVNLEQPAMFFALEGESITITAPGGINAVKGTLVPGEDPGVFGAEYPQLPDLDESLSKLEFSDFGQEIYSLDRKSDVAGCFQEGAAHEAALHRFNLNTPKPGVFNCRSSEGEANTAIEILGENQYRMSGSTGNVSWETVTVDDSSTVLFSSGPLKNLEAEYSENPSSGVQTFEFSKSSSKVFWSGAATSSTSLSAQCVRQTTPSPYKRYGKNTPPQVTQPKQELIGHYFKDTSYLTSTQRGDNAGYAEFNPNGYVHLDQPIFGLDTCALTHPNGLPICQQYDFDGSNLSLISPWGDKETMPVKVTGDGVLTTMGDDSVELLTPVNSEDVVGAWHSQRVYSSSLASCIVGSCVTSITDRNLVFTKDGKYTYTVNGKNSSSFNSGIGISMSNGSRRNGDDGRYRISQNTLTLNTDTDAAIDLPIHVTADGKLVVGEFQYGKQ